MNKLKLSNDIENILMTLEKLRFASGEISEFFDENMEQPEQAEYERNRLRPLNNIMIDLIAEVSEDVLTLFKEVETARLTEKDNQQYHART